MFSYLPSGRSSSSFGVPGLGLQHYRDADSGSSRAAVDAQGTLLEYEALELRLHPPNISIDNESFPDRSVVILDSANRPGTLVEVVQCLTELGLSVKQARISSDGGWFVDEFHVSETPSGRVTDPRKLAVLKRVLSLPDGEPGGEPHTVFQVAGPETPGLLADLTQLLSHNGLDVQTAAAWTFNSRAAIVIGVTERGSLVADRVKLNRLRHLLQKMVSKNGDAAVSVEQVTGAIHHERRLHQLMLADEVKAWRQLTRLQQHHSLPFPAPGAADTDAESDQLPHTPRTPQHQWQRRMLPPDWTVDTKQNRPMLRHDVQQEQDQQQQQWRQQQQQCDMDDAALAAAAIGQPAQQPAAVRPGPAADINQQLAALQQPALLPPLPVLMLAAPVSSAAGAAEQASSVRAPEVRDLMAFLQQQPLPQARQQPYGELSGPAPAGAEPERAAAAAPTPAPAGAAAAASSSGLPPRGPSGIVGLAGLAPINIHVSSSAPPAPGGLPASLSAPCSPLAPGRPSAALWSPAHLASAAAAAGILSPRAALGRPHADASSAAAAAAQRPGQLLAAAGGAADAWAAPEVSVKVQFSALFGYWLVTIRCADRNKLFFDTVVTLADLRLDIFHATIDSEPATGFANQLFYARPRFGDGRWDERKAELLQVMLVSAVKRRFPPGLRVHVFAGSNACLQGLVESLRRQAITITRCKVRAYDTPLAPMWGGAGSEARDTSHTFYLMGRDGSLPSRQQVQAACQAAGGELVDAPLDLTNPGVAAVLRSLDSRGRFAYSFANARSQQRAAASAAWPAAAPAAGAPVAAGSSHTHPGGSDHGSEQPWSAQPSF